MARIQIATFCEGAHVTRADGARLRQAIKEHWQRDEPVVLDFSDTRIASVSFFDESIGLLAVEYPLEELTAHMEIEHINSADLSLLNSIVRSRARERKDAAADSTQTDE
jgi:hypothetical protein